MKNKKINFKRIIIIATLIYVVYTFFVQQKELNAYKADSKRYSEQIATEEEKKEKEKIKHDDHTRRTHRKRREKRKIT